MPLLWLPSPFLCAPGLVCGGELGPAAPHAYGGMR